jgi:hypothetical protein
LKKCFRAHFPRVDENEDKDKDEDKDDAALTCKEWKEGGAARPSTYVMKYIMKTLGAGDDSETDADDSDRLAAWAGHVGMRRMSLVGLLPGTVGRWRAALQIMIDTQSRLIDGMAQVQSSIQVLHQALADPTRIAPICCKWQRQPARKLFYTLFDF